MRYRRFVWVLCASTWFATRPAAADPLRLHGAAGAAHALGGYQEREFGWGVWGAGALELPLTKALGLELELASLWLAEGAAPRDPKLERGSATASAIAAGYRVRPFANAHQGQIKSPAGLWFAANAGLTLTNALTRGMFDVHLGYDFLDRKARTGVGPELSLTHVFQPDSTLRPEDANLILLGVHVMYDFGPKSRPNGDRDQDGILDDQDACPDLPEDKDGFQDQDGCPDLDNDKDGISDKLDKCPNVPEDKDGFEDSDGCPDLDNDKDGIPDSADNCPNDAEDKDGFEDADGCPDLDNDKDGIPDARDLCPNEPETFNGYADNDGCPDEDQVRVVGDKIVLDDRVHFYVNSFVIRHISYPLLTRLAKLVQDHPEYVHVSVEGHADERGPDSFNQKLSEDRAHSVLEFLIKQGVASDRLGSIGFGSTRPLVDKKSEYALLLNRRVEFTVTRKLMADGSKVVSAPGPAPSPPVNPDEAPGNDGIPEGALPTPDGTEAEPALEPKPPTHPHKAAPGAAKAGAPR